MAREEDVIVSVTRSPNGTLSVDGDNKIYTQRIIRGLALEMREFSLSRSYSSLYTEENQDRVGNSILSGIAEIESDRLGIIGRKDYVKKIPTSLRPLPLGEPIWTGVIGHIGKQWEFNDDASYYCELYVEKSAFDEMVIEHHANRLKVLSLRLKTDLWAFDYDYYAPPSGSVSWHLPPGSRGSVSFPGTCRAEIEVLRWFDAIGEFGAKSPTTSISDNSSKQPLPVKLQSAHVEAARDEDRNWRRVIRALWALVLSICALTIAILFTK